LDRGGNDVREGAAAISSSPRISFYPMADESASQRAEEHEGRELLLAARDGDENAARGLVAAHGGSMVRTAWRVLGCYGDREADDVIQEAFIAALTTKALPTGDVGAWLRAIVARKALDSLRRVRRRDEQPLPEPGVELGEFEASSDAGTPLDVIAVRRALAQLAPADRAVLTLVDLEGRSMAEAAAALGLTRVAIRLRAVRARRKLARLIREGPGGSR
jgi:RNA polymerase sigma-70 factor (ECF subfamily)